MLPVPIQVIIAKGFLFQRFIFPKHRSERLCLNIQNFRKLTFRNLKKKKNYNNFKIMGFATLEPQIYPRDPRLPIPSRVMASSAMGLNLGVFGFLPTTHAKTNAKQMRSRSSRAVRRFTRVCLHAQTAVHAGNIRT